MSYSSREQIRHSLEGSTNSTITEDFLSVKCPRHMESMNGNLFEKDNKRNDVAAANCSQ